MKWIFVLINLVLVITEYNCRVSGVACYAGPNVFGPRCQSNTAVLGGQYIAYKIEPQESQVSPQLCCNARSYSPNENWVSIGCSSSSFTSLKVPWSNSAAYPAVECRGVPTGVFYTFST